MKRIIEFFWRLKWVWDVGISLRGMWAASRSAYLEYGPGSDLWSGDKW